MKLDSSKSLSIADNDEQKKVVINKTQSSKPMQDVRDSGGTQVAEVEKNSSASEGENLSKNQVYTFKGSTLQPVEFTEPIEKPEPQSTPNTHPWCYLKTHYSKVEKLESAIAETEQFNCFVHRTNHYEKKQGNGHVKEIQKETISGLVFIQGRANEIQQFLNDRFMGCYLLKDCATDKVAEIPNSQMIPFMHVAETDPKRIRALLKPFEQYAKDNTLLRVVSGPLAGMEGYVLRIGRERSLVMNFGGRAVAIQGVHKEMFEVV